MDICIAIIILSLVMLGFMFYLMLSVHSMGMASLDDITEKTPEEERKDEFDQISGGKKSGLAIGPQAPIPQEEAVKKLHKNPRTALRPQKRARSNRK